MDCEAVAADWWAHIAACAGVNCLWHCGDLYSVLFHYYSLGDDTAMPGGIHARFCQAFLIEHILVG